MVESTAGGPVSFATQAVARRLSALAVLCGRTLGASDWADGLRRLAMMDDGCCQGEFGVCEKGLKTVPGISTRWTSYRTLRKIGLSQPETSPCKQEKIEFEGL